MHLHAVFTEQYKDFNPILQAHNVTAGSPSANLFMAAFPCNQFHLQEPGNNDEILNGLRYVRPGNNFTPHPNLHIYGKLDVNGENAHPMYKYLRESCPPTTKVIAPR
uniref:glutathione peroxidase n=1 Tax=Romanomermis culicivorax TaxID=13658 RepID=A0A915JBF8_ROMCU